MLLFMKLASSAAAIILIAVFWLIPIGLLPFSNIVPFMPNASVEVISVAAILNSAAIAFALWFGSSKKNKQIFLSTVTSARDKGVLVIGVIAFTASSVFLSPNSLVLLFGLLPAEKIISEYEVVSKTARGKRYKTITVQLRSPSKSEEYRLVLSKSAPFYTDDLVSGNKIIIGGRRNWIGTYVDSLITAR